MITLFDSMKKVNSLNLNISELDKRINLIVMESSDEEEYLMDDIKIYNHPLRLILKKMNKTHCYHIITLNISEEQQPTMIYSGIIPCCTILLLKKKVKEIIRYSNSVILEEKS